MAGTHRNAEKEAQRNIVVVPQLETTFLRASMANWILKPALCTASNEMDHLASTPSVVSLTLTAHIPSTAWHKTIKNIDLSLLFSLGSCTEIIAILLIQVLTHQGEFLRYQDNSELQKLHTNILGSLLVIFLSLRYVRSQLSVRLLKWAESILVMSCTNSSSKHRRVLKIPS